MKFKRLFSISMVIILALAGSLWQSAAVSAGSGWLTVGPAGFSAGAASETSLALDKNNVPYVAYEDGANGYKVTVMKYNGAAWETVGSAGFSAGLSVGEDLVLDKNNVPYVAYDDGANGYKATVMKYNGATWETVGPADFSNDAAWYLSLALDSHGTPYVAYTQLSSSPENNRATVMKFNGTGWVPVGVPYFTPVSASYLSLKLDKNDTPYVAYRDGPYRGAVVMKYDNGVWANVGSPFFSDGNEIGNSLALDSSNMPYVAYQDKNSRVMVKMYNGTDWVTVGSPEFSLSMIYYPYLVLDSNDTPYVAYIEQGTLGIDKSATVMKYTGGAWVPVGSAGFSPYTTWSLSLALDSNGTPYVSYEDGSQGNHTTVMKYYAVLPPAGFNKTAPTNAATEVNPNATLSWAASDGAASYAYCYDTTNNNICNASWISAGANTSVSLSGLKAKTTYYWQVRAVNGTGTTYSDASTWWNFTTSNYKVFLPLIRR